MNKLYGTIYWFIGNLKPVQGDYKTTAQVTTITDVIIDENFIKFDWQGTKDFVGGMVNLQPEHGTRYKGVGRIIDEDSTVTVDAELFENKKKYVLHGTWVEATEHYTWFAEITK